MYIIDDIAYAGGTPTIRVVSVHPLDNYKLRLQFNTNEEKIYDLVPLLATPVFAPLKDKVLFQNVRLDHGIPVWLDGEIDLAPEKLYTDGITLDGNALTE